MTPLERDDAAHPGAEADGASVGSARPAGPARRSVWSVLGAAVSAVAVLGVVAAVAVAGTFREPVAPQPVPLTAVDVPAPATDLVCPGTVRLPTEPEAGSDVAYDPQFDPAPVASSAALAAISVLPQGGDTPAAARLDPLGAPTEPPLATLAPTGPAAGVTLDGLTGSLVLHAEPAGEVPAWVAGATVVRTPDGDLRGLVGASCAPATGEVWLVGGGTSLGSSARLVLDNPGQTPAVVGVELWGPTGPVELAGAPQYLVPAGGERALLLEGVAAEQERIVVRLSATGGLVGAHLQDSALRGLVPAGTDYVVAGAGPATDQVVTAVSVAGSAADGADVGVLRLLAPGTEDGTARIAVLGPDGAVELPGAEEVALEAGAVLDVPLGGLPAGRYTLVVDADVAVVAGAMLTRGSGVGLPPDLAQEPVDQAPLDRAWVPAATVGTAGPLALPPGASGELVLAAVGEPGGPADVSVDVIGADGVLGTTTMRVPSGTTSALSLDALTGASDGATGLVVRSADPRLVWGVVLTEVRPDGDLVAVLSPVAPAVDRPSLEVRVR
ncbi:MAG TPA: DUF5719 family protein [Actinotalea sp.]|nr:DUF5719 family protein [Actinotalea sp.]